MVQDVLLSQEFEISPAFVTITERKGDGLVGGTSRAGREESSMLSVGLEPELKRVLEENA